MCLSNHGSSSHTNGSHCRVHADRVRRLRPQSICHVGGICRNKRLCVHQLLFADDYLLYACTLVSRVFLFVFVHLFGGHSKELLELLTESELNFVFHWWFRCYAEELANKTIDEIREIYSSYPDPSCTPYQGQSEHRQFDSVAYELKGGEGRCDRWFYDYDHGYHSMSSEVQLGQFLLIFFELRTKCFLDRCFFESFFL